MVGFGGPNLVSTCGSFGGVDDHDTRTSRARCTRNASDARRNFYLRSDQSTFLSIASPLLCNSPSSLQRIWRCSLQHISSTKARFRMRKLCFQMFLSIIPRDGAIFAEGGGTSTITATATSNQIEKLRARHGRTRRTTHAEYVLHWLPSVLQFMLCTSTRNTLVYLLYTSPRSPSR